MPMINNELILKNLEMLNDYPAEIEKRYALDENLLMMFLYQFLQLQIEQEIEVDLN
jgi:hypothetical protein